MPLRDKHIGQQAKPAKQAKQDAPDKELAKLRRLDLLEMLVETIRENEDLAATNQELSEQNDRLKAKLDDKDAQIEHLKQRLDAKDAHIAQMEQQAQAAADAGIVDLQGMLDAGKGAMESYLQQVLAARPKEGKHGTPPRSANSELTGAPQGNPDRNRV